MGWIEIEKYAIVSGLWVDLDEGNDSQAELLLGAEGSASLGDRGAVDYLVELYRPFSHPR